jgi:hypothetical protein
VEQIAAKGREFARDAIVFVRVKSQIIQHIEMEPQNSFRFGERALLLAFTQRLRDFQQAIGDALHSGNYDDHLHALRRGPHETGGVQHALGTQQRAAAEFEGD